MKASQKLVIEIEQVKMVCRFDEIDSKLIPLVAKLEKEGDMFGPVSDLIYAPNPMCVTARYADKRRGAAKVTIFGYEQDTLLSMQYK